jgi:hypothetical protein
LRSGSSSVTYPARQLLVQVAEQFVEPLDFAGLEIAAEALLKRFDISPP